MSGPFTRLEMPPSLLSMAESAAQMDADWRTQVPEHVRTSFITRFSQELSRITGDNDREKTWRAASKFEIKHWSSSANRATYMNTMVRKIDSLQKKPTNRQTASPLMDTVISDENDLDGIEDFVLPPPAIQHTLLRFEGDVGVQQQQLREVQRVETAQLLQRQLREQHTLVQFHHLNWVSPDECFAQLRLLQQRHETERSQRQQQMSEMRAELVLNHIQQQSITASLMNETDSSQTPIDTSTAEAATSSGGATAEAAEQHDKLNLVEAQTQRLMAQLTRLREQQQEIAMKRARATAPDLQAKLAQQAEKIAQVIDKILHHFENHEMVQSQVATTPSSSPAAVVDTSQTSDGTSNTDAVATTVASDDDEGGGGASAAAATVLAVDAPLTAPAITEEASAIVSTAMREQAAKALSTVLLRVNRTAGREAALAAATEYEQSMWSSHEDKLAYKIAIKARAAALMHTVDWPPHTLKELLTMPLEQLPKRPSSMQHSIPIISSGMGQQQQQLQHQQQQQQQQYLERLRQQQMQQQQQQQQQPQAAAMPARPVTPPIGDGFLASRDTYSSSSVWTDPAWLALIASGKTLIVQIGSLLTQHEHSEVWRSACGKYALKGLRGNPAMTDVAAFVTRVSMLSSLNSGRVVKPVAALGSSALTLHVVTAYAERGDLQSLLLRSTGDNSSSELNWAEDKSVIALDVAEALAYLHSTSSSEDAKTKTKAAMVVVGDLHTGHVLVDSDGHARVNLVQFSASSANVSSEKKQEGGFAYWRSPEVLQGGVATTASDMYAFGVLLCELDTGVVPYSEAFDAGFEPADVQAGVVSGELRPSVSDACPPRIEQLAIECMVAEAAARPSAAQVVYRLRDILKNDL